METKNEGQKESQGGTLRVGEECKNERDKGELHFPIFDESCGCVAHVKKESDAKRIVQCVNAFDDLLKALKDSLSELKGLMHDERCDHSVGICYCDTFRTMEAANSAIAKAEAQP